MIPLLLKLSGFLSYRDPIEVDFTGFDLACISGSNGAGKSSLLDAITWSLFGQARKRDEAVINLQSNAALVEFTFTYEGSVYRVIRALARGKTTSLEFQIADDGRRTTNDGEMKISGGPSSLVDGLNWKPLTERTLRDTQTRIEQILRLDYETFVNVSFFLQGRADQFAQQPPTRRKDILGSILGLEIWEIYRDRASERRKSVERDLDSVAGHLAEIESELGEEAIRKAHLSELESRHRELVASRKLEEAALASAQQAQAALIRQRDLVTKSEHTLETSKANLSSLKSRLTMKQTERSAHASLVERASEVETAYKSLQKARTDLEKWEQVAERFREHDQRRQPLLREIESEGARLEQEKTGLEKQNLSIQAMAASADVQQAKLATARQTLEQAQARVDQKQAWDKQAGESRQKQAGLSNENKNLKTAMDDLKDRIKKLSAAEGAVCPLCGQSLSPEHRKSTLDQLNAEGKSLGDRWRENKSALEQLDLQVTQLESQLSSVASADTDRLEAVGRVTQLTERIDSVQQQSAQWQQDGARRLVEITRILETGAFAQPARKKLASVDKELAALGYDAASHDAARRTELQARPAEDEYRALESARAALKPLEDEIANLESNVQSQQASLDQQQSEHDLLAKELEALEASAPDLESAERNALDLLEQENRLTIELGGARQLVASLDKQRKKKKDLETQREELGRLIGRYKTLERAFGKDGVPALLIEQALPEIEMKANEILGRLSEDTMRLHFETQAKYKDEKRKDLRETLEIQVSDGAGMRDYEMYSGGEAFRVNFAIRLALSEVLAQRKGARLQMLVIDEGFGSQDALGRQRLIQAINAVKPDFAKILVITHLEELKDAFPTRIEVEKGERGSEVVVI